MFRFLTLSDLNDIIFNFLKIKDFGKSVSSRNACRVKTNFIPKIQRTVKIYKYCYDDD